MSLIFNEQRRLGVHIVADGTILHNGHPVIGIREVPEGTLFSDNQRVLGLDILSGTETLFNDEDVIGAVRILDGRALYNNLRVIPVKVISGSAVAPATITATPFNDAMDANTISVETWLGREIAMLSADIPGCTFTLVDDAGGRFSIGGGKILRHEKISAGAIGTQYKPKIIARSPAGVDSAPIELTFTVSKFRFPTSRVYAFWDYTDPSTMTLDGNGRIIKLVDKVKGAIREHSGGYGNTAPGTNAPTYAAGKVRFDRSKSQYLKLAPDAVNDPIRQILGVTAPQFSHILVCRPLQDVTQTFFSYIRPGPYYKTALRMAAGGALSMFRGPGGTNANGFAYSPIRPVNLTDLTKPTILALSSQGDVMTIHRNDQVDYATPSSTHTTAVSDISDCEIGRFSSTGTSYADMEVLAEIIVQGELCPSELRGLWDSFPEWGIGTRVDPEMIDLAALVDTDQKIFEDDFDTLSIEPSFANYYGMPSTKWVSGLGSQAQALGCDAANGNEGAFHLMWNDPLQEKYNTIGVTEGKLRLSTVPLSAPETSDAFYKIAARTARGNSGAIDYTHMGAAVSTRAICAPMYAIWEIRSKNPPAMDSNFACLGWMMHDGGGHPPEVDIIEQPGSINAPSTGLHMSPRWPEAAGGSSSYANSGRKATSISNQEATDKYPKSARALLDREIHTYHCVFDRATDTIKYYQDGYLFYSQQPQKGIRLSSFRTQNANWAGGTGQGSGIVADNGTNDGPLSVYVEGGGRAGSVHQNDLANAIIVVAGGKATQLILQNPGTYFNGTVPLTFKKRTNVGGVYDAIVCTTQPTCYLEVGTNDPVFPTDFDAPMFMILNNAQGNFTTLGGNTGLDRLTRTTHGYVDLVRAWKPKRSAPVITTPIQSAADAHCANLFAAIQLSTGQPVPGADQTIINAAIAKMMATVRRWDVPMDGSDPLWDGTKSTLWDSLVGFSFFFGPFAYGSAINWRNLFVGSKVGAPVWNSAKGFIFDGRAGGGQYLDFQEQLSVAANANLFRPLDNSMSILLTQKPSAGKALLPAMGAGATVAFNIAADDVADPNYSFSHLQGATATVVSERKRLALPLGFTTLTRREQRWAAWANGNMKRPHGAGYWTARQPDGTHSAYQDAPNAPIKVGSHSSAVAGFDGAIGGVAYGRWWTDEEHKAFLDIWKPYFLKYNVPGISA